MIVERILQLIDERGITAAKTLSDLGLARSAMSERKKGNAKPGVDAIIKIAEYFGVTTDYLLTGKQQKNNQPTLRLVDNPKEDIHMENSCSTSENTSSLVPVFDKCNIFEFEPSSKGVAINASLLSKLIEGEIIPNILELDLIFEVLKATHKNNPPNHNPNPQPKKTNNLRRVRRRTFPLHHKQP